MTIFAWMTYPIVYLIPMMDLGGQTSFVAVQIAYSISDVIAKAGVGLIIYQVTYAKSKRAAMMEASGQKWEAPVVSRGLSRQRSTEKARQEREAKMAKYQQQDSSEYDSRGRKDKKSKKKKNRDSNRDSSDDIMRQLQKGDPDLMRQLQVMMERGGR